jgi:hypothetical protein
LQTALKYQPGNARYGLRAAQIYLRQNKFKEAIAIAEKLSNSDDEQIRSRAQQLVTDIREYQAKYAQYEEEKKKYEEARAAQGPPPGGRMTVRTRAGQAGATRDLARAREESRMRSLNEALRVPGAGEKRLVGTIAKIECRPRSIVYTIASDEGSFQLSSKDFQELIVTNLLEDHDGEIGCKANLAGINTVLSYKPSAGTASPVRGQLVSVEFVPKAFRFVDPDTDADTDAAPASDVLEEEVLPSSPPGTGAGSGTGIAVSGPPAAQNYEAERRKAMMQSIADSLRKPGPGERRVLGIIEKSECTSKGMFFFVKAGVQVLKLNIPKPQALIIRGYTPDMEGLQIGCGMKNVDIPVVVVYKDIPDAKAKLAGELLSLEFVPKSFQLAP